MKEFIIFVCTDSTEIFFSKLRSADLTYNLPFFSLTHTVRGGGVSNKHCLLTFFHFFYLSRHVRSRHIVYGPDTWYMDIFYQATLCRWTVLEVHTDE